MTKRKPQFKSLSIDRIVRGHYQPRQYFDPVKLQELADSIKSTDGLIQPIVVRPLDDRYEIVAGERRWRAAQIAGLTEVSCLICDYTNEQALQAAIVENIIRSNLNPIEEARAYLRLIEDFNYLHEEVAASVGKSRTAITNSLRLLKLVKAVQDLLISGELTEGHGKMIASLLPQQQLTLAHRCVANGWSVRKLENEAKKIQQIHLAKPPTFSDANIKQLETELSKHVGNRVQLNYETEGGGYLHIRFNNVDELEGHFEKMGFVIKP